MKMNVGTRLTSEGYKVNTGKRKSLSMKGRVDYHIVGSKNKMFL